MTKKYNIATYWTEEEYQHILKQCMVLNNNKKTGPFIKDFCIEKGLLKDMDLISVEVSENQ